MKNMKRAFRLFGKRDPLGDVDDELAFHLDARVQQLITDGLTPEAARTEALRQFGDVARVRDDCVSLDKERDRSMQRANLLDELRMDVAFAFRMLRRNAGIAAVIIVSLAVGIGANATIFSLVDAVLLRTLAVTRPNELVLIGDAARVSSMSVGDGLNNDMFSVPMYEEVRGQAHTVTGLAAMGRTGRIDVLIDSGGAPAEHPRGRMVSANYFSVLGVPAAHGKVFDGSEDRAAGAAPVAVISDSYWERRFAGAPGAVGRTIRVNGAAVTIIGVAPSGFDGEVVGAPTEIFFPISLQPVIAPSNAILTSRTHSWLTMLGRLAPDKTLKSVTMEFTSLVGRAYIAHPLGTTVIREDQLEGFVPLVSSGARGLSRVRQTYDGPLKALSAGVALLLLIICANVANLLLARTAARSREIGVRLAIGAGRGRLIRQLLTESTVLALLGGTSALILAQWGSKLLLALEADGNSTIPLDVRLNLPVLGFTLAVSLGAVLLFGLAPAFRAARHDLATALRSGTRSVGAGGRNGRPAVGMWLVGAQVALSVVMLVESALLVQNLRQIEHSDPGLDRDHLIIADVDVARGGYRGDRARQLASTLTTKLRALPGVAGVSYSENGIFSGTESVNTLQVPGFTPNQASDTASAFDQVGPGYVAAIGGRISAGRDIEDGDITGAAPVGLANESFAKFYLPNGNAIGATIRFDDSTTARIVGIVADTKDHSLTAAPARRFYLAWQQATLGDPGSLRMIVRTTGAPSTVLRSVRDAIVAAEPTLPLVGLSPLSVTMRASVREQRLLMRLATGFGVLALVLCAVGLYGVMSYAISRRTGEIGLRVALGASRPDVVRMILGDASKVVLSGAAVGLVLAVWGATLMKAQMNRVSPLDPAALIAALATLGLAALLAALVPALRASRVPPVEALRAE